MDDLETTLFRREVYAAERDKWLGKVTQTAPIPRGLRIAFSLFVMFALTVFLACLEYARHVQVTGVVAPRAIIESPPSIAIGT